MLDDWLKRNGDISNLIVARARHVGAAWALPVILLVASVFASYHAQASNSLLYLRDAVLGGEVYRLITFHFVHISISHFLLNAFTLAALWVLYGKTMRTGEWLGSVIACGVIVGLGLVVVSPEMEWSAGLSGLLYALLGYTAVRTANSTTYLHCAVVVFLIVKIVVEQVTGPSATMEQIVGTRIAVDAHMIGVVVGLFLGITSRGIRRMTHTLRASKVGWRQKVVALAHNRDEA